MAATELKLYGSGDVWVHGENPTSTKMNDNTLIHHQDEFERRDALVFKWLQQVAVDDSVANTATYNTFDVVVNGKRYYASSLSIDMNSLTVSTQYHVRFWVSDMDLHVSTDSLDGDGLYIGTIEKDGAGAVTMTLLPCHILVNGICATTIAIMPSDASPTVPPLLMRYYGGVVETSVDNGSTWTGIGGGTSDHSALSNLAYATSGHSGFATSAQGALADSAVQPGDLPDFGDIVTHDASEFLTSVSIPVKAVYSEINTGTDDAKFLTAMALQLSKRNVRHMEFGVLAPDADQTVAQVGGTRRSRIAGVIIAVGCYDEVAGTTGTATYDIFLNGTTIMASTKISIETGEDSSLTATTQPVLTTTAIAVDDKLTFKCDAINTTPAQGLTFWIDVRET